MSRQPRAKHENQHAKESTVSVDLNAVPRVAQALRLRRLGLTYEEIAKRCGYNNESSVRLAVKKASAKIIRDEARELVAFQLDHIDAALQVVMQRIAKDDEGSLWAIDRLIPLLKRQAELMALDKQPDAPQAAQIVIAVPGAEAI